MNQTVTVNISGIVFHIEVDAYDNLRNYLNKIKSYFKNSEESEEIMLDIEARIAEIFNSKLSNSNQVIGAKDVDEVIKVMGKPEQYLSEDEETEKQTDFSSNSNNHGQFNTSSQSKRVFRNPDDRVIGGVASGIGLYIGIDRVWLRLFFIAGLFMGFGFLLYLILWIVIPLATTASDKLQMRGEPVNVDSIGKTFEQEANNVAENFRKNGNQFGKQAESVFQAFFVGLGGFLNTFFKGFGKILGLGFFIIGMLIFISIFFWGGSFVFGGFSYVENGTLQITSDNNTLILTKDFFPILFDSTIKPIFVYTSIILVTFIPLIALIYFGLKLIFGIKGNRNIGKGLVLLWLIGIVSCFIIVISTSTKFRSKSEFSHQEEIKGNHKTLFLQVDEYSVPGDYVIGDFDDDFFLSKDDEKLYCGYPSFDIEKSKDDKVHLEIIKASSGSTKRNSIKNAKSITYNFLQQDSLITLNSYMEILKPDKFRNQHLNLSLKLPIGQIVYLDASLKNIIYDIHNVSNTWDGYMMDKKWIMLEEGLTCLDCDGIKGITSEELVTLKK